MQIQQCIPTSFFGASVALTSIGKELIYWNVIELQNFLWRRKCVQIRIAIYMCKFLCNEKLKMIPPPSVKCCFANVRYGTSPITVKFLPKIRFLQSTTDHLVITCFWSGNTFDVFLTPISFVHWSVPRSLCNWFTVRIPWQLLPHFVLTMPLKFMSSSPYFCHHFLKKIILNSDAI